MISLLKSDLTRMGKGETVAQFEVLAWNMPQGTQEKDGNLLSTVRLHGDI
jgi:hypothetical protein